MTQTFPARVAEGTVIPLTETGKSGEGKMSWFGTHSLKYTSGVSRK